MKRKWKQVLAVFLALTISISTTNMSALAMENSDSNLLPEQEISIIENSISSGNNSYQSITQNSLDNIETELTYQQENYEVTYIIANSWEDACNVTIKIKNISEESLDDWKIVLTMENQIQDIWNAEVEAYENGTYTIQNNGWNKIIEANDSIEFGFTTKESFQGFPENCSLLYSNSSVKNTKYVGENYEVDFQIITKTIDTFEGNLILTNTGTEMIENWSLTFDFNHEIIDIWNAQISLCENNCYTIKNVEHNQDIAPGESIIIGFQAKWTDKIESPINYSLSIVQQKLPTTVYFVDYIVTSDWGNGFTGEFRITNNSEQTIEDWILEFDYNVNIEKFWTAEIIAHEANHYIVKNAGYNANIESGQTISLGFLGYPGNISIVPSNFQLSELVVGEASSDEPQYAMEWSEMQDTDGDELPDDYETEIGTDIYNIDTDGDGLTDGFEVLYGSSNPLNAFTEDSSPDSQADPDKDGLTMLEEYNLGTHPLEYDTDNDGLSDGSEVNVYGTNPLFSDTDEDSISDCDEVKIGLDPLNPNTFGYPDAEYQFIQTIDKGNDVFDNINVGNNDYQMSFTIQAQGNVLSNILVRESAYSNIIDSEYILGIIPEILCTKDGNIQELTLKFEIDSNNIYNDCNINCFKGIKKYNIFKYDEEECILCPVNTIVDEENNLISSTVDDIGTYCIIDMEKWLKDLGYEFVANDSSDVSLLSFAEEPDTSLLSEETESLPSASETSENISPEFETEAATTLEEYSLETYAEKSESRNIIDLIFCINNKSHGLSDIEFESIKENMLIIGKSVFYESGSARIYVVDQHGNIVQTSNGKDYATNSKHLETMIEQLSNSTAQTPSLTEQTNVLLNTLALRDNAFKTAVFIGDSSIPSNGSSTISKIANADIHCCVVEPRTQSGSWYDRLSLATNGLLIYNFLEFSDELLEYIYGYIPEVPFVTYTLINSTQLKTTTLEAELNSLSDTDTDKDGLTDWDEIDKCRVTINSDGNVVLQTYKEYVDFYCDSYTWYQEWSARYDDLKNKDGKSIDEILSEIYVLPIVSDPTSIDGDDDGILDCDEFEWDGIDERYKNIGPLHKDTIETLFPEITQNGKNKSSYPSYITVDDNNVVLHLNVVFEGETSTLASSALKTTDLSTAEQSEVNKIIARLGSDFTLKELVIDGIENRWNGTYIGTEYDFYKGLQVNFSVDLQENLEPKWYSRKIKITLQKGLCGVSNAYTSSSNWNTNSNRFITLYTSYCGDSSHKDKDGTSCSKYQNSLYNMATYAGTIAHEFGHIFGLKDLYIEASVNHGYEPISNDEIKYDTNYFGIPTAFSIMKNNGCAVANDIEMVLLAFSENAWQYYVPYGRFQKMSKAIKLEPEFRSKDDTSNTYVWNASTYTFEIK